MKNQELDYEVIVIGAGPAGMMASGVAAQRGLKVLLLEKNDAVGNKLSITGGGRCNILNAEFDTRTLLGHYAEAKQFLFSPFSQFSVEQTIRFFESQGLELEVEAFKRAFPKSRKASEVTTFMRAFCQRQGVNIMTGVTVRGFAQGSDGAVIGVETSEGRLSASSYVLATGGVSYPETGSTGEGFDWLKRIGHSVVSPSPSITPIRVEESWVKARSGLTIESVVCRVKQAGETKYRESGKLLFTHFGLSGPVILRLAGRIGELLGGGTVTLELDFFPTLDQGSLDQKIVAVLDENKNKEALNALKELLPAGFARAVTEQIPSFGEKKAHSVTRDERKQLVHFLKQARVTVTGLMGFDWAVVADGGVPLTEVDTKTMRSKLHDNLYLVGDVLHINRPSGGFSLQLCWTTGFVAGSAVCG